jgi:hypothetical protein
LRQWIRQRGATFLVVLLLLAPFGLMGAVNGIRVALGVAPVATQSRSTFPYTENQIVIIDSVITVVDDPPIIENRTIFVDYLSSGPVNKPITQKLFVQSGVGQITVTGSGPLQIFYGAD